MVAERKKISPYMVWFVIHPIQFGMAELWFARFLMEDAGFDGWIGVIIAGLAVHLLIWLIYGILNKGEGSAVSIHKQIFGKWLGGGFSLLLILFFVLEGIFTLRSYAEIIQVWLFPGIRIWVIGVMMLFLVYYAIGGGFRVVVGVCFFGFLIPLVVLTGVLIPPLHYSNFNNMLPVFNHPMSDLLKAAKDMTLGYIGFEGLLIAYPFVKKPRASQKWAHAGNLFTTLFYLWITFIMFSFFNENLMERLIWPKMNLVQLTQLPFLAGFQYVFISLWMMVILPNLTYAVWAASRAAKELFSVRHRKTLAVVCVVIFVVPLFLSDHEDVRELDRLVALCGFYFLMTYIPFLWIAQRVIERWRKRRRFS
ncbi:MAG TPA: GerAB/ArcD/ProY family transporter [Bacillales bacterium]|nr:GerAB/ArcD/ProY family transporter [Bacillales bacterium]